MLCCCAYLNHEHPIGMKNMLFLEVYLVSSKHKNKTTHGLYTTFKKLMQFIPPRMSCSDQKWKKCDIKSGIPKWREIFFVNNLLQG